MKSAFCSVIIVTNNSENYLPKTMRALALQTLATHQIIIVDTGSKNLEYLESYSAAPHISILFAEKDSGFCKGNNIGFQHLHPESEFVFLVNPDLFLAPDFLEKAVHFMQQPSQKNCGALTGTTLGYSIQLDKPTGTYDSTGIFSTWYGRWHDRGQGNLSSPQLFSQVEEIPAICGAVFFCRRAALEMTLIKGKEILDSSFYMYKEDIDLSLRLRRAGWKLVFVPDLTAYHCRGWSPDRKKMARRFRLCSARNEWRIHWKMGSPPKILYSTLKWLAVKLFDC